MYASWSCNIWFSGQLNPGENSADFVYLKTLVKRADGTCKMQVCMNACRHFLLKKNMENSDMLHGTFLRNLSVSCEFLAENVCHRENFEKNPSLFQNPNWCIWGPFIHFFLLNSETYKLYERKKERTAREHSNWIAKPILFTNVLKR